MPGLFINVFDTLIAQSGFCILYMSKNLRLDGFNLKFLTVKQSICQMTKICISRMCLKYSDKYILSK